jgi:hypothetical protein
MDLKKGLSLVAFGFLFTLVDLNLTIDNATLNCTPDFIGWILLFLAIGALGKYTEGKGFLKVASLLLVILSAAVWVIGLLRAEIDISLVKTAVNLLSAVFMFILFGCLEKVAADFGSSRESTLRILKILSLIENLVFVALPFFITRMSNSLLVGIVAVMGVITIVTAVVIAFVLFGLNKEIGEKL